MTLSSVPDVQWPPNQLSYLLQIVASHRRALLPRKTPIQNFRVQNFCACAVNLLLVPHSNRETVWPILLSQIGIGIAESLSDKNLYPSFVRTVGPTSSHSHALRKLFEYFGWRQCAIISSSQGLFYDASVLFHSLFQKSQISVELFEIFQPGDLDHLTKTVVEMNDIKSRVVIVACYDDDLGRFVWSVYNLGLMQAGWAWITVYTSVISSAFDTLAKLASTAGVPTPPHSVFQGILAIDFDLAPQTEAYKLFQDHVRARMLRRDS